MGTGAFLGNNDRVEEPKKEVEQVPTEQPTGVIETPVENKEEKKGFATEVEGVMADDMVKQGTLEFPVFNISKESFHANMKSDRKRMRLQGSAADYLRGMKYNKDFYVQYVDNDGKTYRRRVK